MQRQRDKPFPGNGSVNAILRQRKDVIRTTEARIVQLEAAVQRGLEPGSRGLAIVRSRYQATTTENTAGSDLGCMEISDDSVNKCN
jgi:hypothetical protein